MTKIVEQADAIRLILSGYRADPYYELSYNITASDGSLTTIISSDFPTGDDIYNVGFIAECIYATNEENIGQRRLIKSYSNVSSQATTDSWLAAVLSGDQFRIIRSGIGFAVEETGGSSTTIDAEATATTGKLYRNEGANFFIDNNEGDFSTYMTVFSADNKSADALVSAWSATQDATVADDSQNTAVGDLYAFVQYDRFNGEATLESPRPDASGKIGSLGKLSSDYNRIRNGSGSITSYLSLAMKTLFKSVYSSTADSSESIIAGSTTTTINFSAGDESTFSIGDLVMINDEIRECTAVDTTGYTITVDPALTAAPAATNTCYLLYQFYPVLGGSLQWFNVEYYLGDFHSIILCGCHANSGFSGKRGELVQLNHNVEALTYFERSVTREWYMQIPSTKYISADRSTVYIGSTAYHCLEWDFNPNISMSLSESLKCPDGKNTKVLSNVDPVLTFTVLFDSNSQKQYFERYTSRNQDVLLQVGDYKHFGLILKNCQLNTSWEKSNNQYVVKVEARPTNYISQGIDAAPFRFAIEP